MPIASDNNYVTIEFQYTASEDPQIQMRVKFHHVDGIPTISLTQDDQNWFDFPASLFPDVTDHLRAQNLLNQPGNAQYAPTQVVPANPYPNPPNAQNAQNAPNVQMQPSVLPAPQIVRTSQMELATNQPLESFEHLSALAVKTAVPVTNERMSSADAEAMSARPLLKGGETSIHRKAMSGEASIKRS